MSTTRKVLETPSGIGKVYKGDQELASVDYRLEVSQEFVDTITSSGQSSLPGPKQITGQFKIIQGKYLAIDGTILTLHLADGRKWYFFVCKINSSRIYFLANTPGGSEDF
ncbi:MAG: hypothetical protein P4L50_23920 [Anaerolineaceae bacterium]|nr:hypothetical protein [Anaerolineaceae bacterium]